MDEEQVASWIAGYERAWRSPGTETLSETEHSRNPKNLRMSAR